MTIHDVLSAYIGLNCVKYCTITYKHQTRTSIQITRFSGPSVGILKHENFCYLSSCEIIINGSELDSVFDVGEGRVEHYGNLRSYLVKCDKTRLNYKPRKNW